MLRYWLICWFCAFGIMWAQAPKDKEYETVIVVYSENEGYGWKAEDKAEKIGTTLSKILASVLEKWSDKSNEKQYNRLLVPLTGKEKSPYAALVNAHLRGGSRQSVDNQSGELAVQFELTRLFYCLRLSLQTTRPLRAARLGVAQAPGDDASKFPVATVIEERPLTTVDDSGVHMRWNYTLAWDNILLDGHGKTIPYQLQYVDGDKPENQEWKLPAGKSCGGNVVLGDKNFPLPAMQWKADDGGNGQLEQMQLVRQPNGLYHIVATWVWKEVRPRSSPALQEFVCPLGNEGLSLLQQQFSPTTTQAAPSAGGDHFVAFRCLYKPFQQLARQQSDKDILFKSNTIVIDYDEFNFVVRVALPNVELPEDAYCWVSYPPKDNEWIAIESQKMSDKRYVFIQPFPARGNLFNLALQLKNRPLRQAKAVRQLYISVPIGIPQEELGRYADKNIEAWGVPWKK